MISRHVYNGPLWVTLPPKLAALGLPHPDPNLEAWLTALDRVCDLAIGLRDALREKETQRLKQGIQELPREPDKGMGRLPAVDDGSRQAQEHMRRRK